MYIQKLSIKNFRCFDKDGIEIDFEEGVTGIIGKNGSGKTSIVEALNLIFGKEYIQNKINERDFNNLANDVKDKIEIVAYTRNPFFVSSEVSYATDTGFRQSAQVLIACNGLKLTIKRREKAERILDDPFTIDRHAIPLEGGVDESIFEKVISDSEKPVIKSVLSPAVDYYNITFKLKSGEKRQTRLFEYQLTYNPSKYKKFPVSYFLSKDREKEVANTYSILSKILTDIHWRYRKTQATELTELSEKYTTLATHLRQVDEKGKLINSICDTINSISSEHGEFSIDFLDTNEPYKGAFISKNVPNRQLIPSSLGSGYHILFSYALAKYIFQLEKEPIVFLIDEPEMHLHIDWQIKLFEKFIGEENVQVVYSTQSENFLSLKYWNMIRVLKNRKIFPKKETLELETEIDSTSYTTKQIIQDYADRNLHISTFLKDNLELFFTQKTILVEGPAEKYSLPKLLQLIGCDISQFSISIIPVWGKGKMKQYQFICKCFGINYFTLFDKDQKNGETFDNDIENSAIENNSMDGQVASFANSFETSLGADGFQNVVKKVDEITTSNEVNTTLSPILSSIKTFIESN